MKKLGLRAEHLGELSTDELRAIAGAAGGGEAPAATVSDGSCVCSLLNAAIRLRCDVSDGSCACGCDNG